MTGGELEVLTRAHQLFAASTWAVPLDAGLARYTGVLGRTTELNTGDGQERYHLAVNSQRDALRSTAQTDAAATDVIAAARDDHALARVQTGNVVEEALADGAVAPDNPLAQREAMRRRAARLRAQHAHVRSARGRALQHRAALHRVRYRHGRRRRNPLAGLRLPPPDSRAGRAVRAALSRLGRPYVWGATGPEQFDCSGLTQWSYAQAGIHLDRTTYQQIHDGIPVPRSFIRPGDLVFPSTGHVQMAIGNNLVVEAPHAGATVQLSPLGTHVAIRRPTG
jgi:cell wall-associated NlpC family hydrolase